VRELAERACFAGCLTLGRLLRSARYSRADLAHQDGLCQVRKRRLFYAPPLVWLGGLAMRTMNTGVRVLPQRAWHERERLLYRLLHATTVGTDADGMLVLPCLAGRTLARVLEDPAVEEAFRTRAIELAVLALAELHHLGFTHGDAMAGNVMVAGAAHWFDFETIHQASRPMTWRRADDVRALLTTCLVRTDPGKRAATLRNILDVYGDEAVTHVVAESFTSVFRRPLTFHLAQAALSFEGFREIGRLLRERLGLV
jgi:hypothetical protein